jgi:hypothetical protein
MAALQNTMSYPTLGSLSRVVTPMESGPFCFFVWCMAGPLPIEYHGALYYISSRIKGMLDPFCYSTSDAEIRMGRSQGGIK